MWTGVDSGMGAGPTAEGYLGRVQYRSESALAYFVPVQLFCAGLLVPVYLAVLVRCFIIADAEVPQAIVKKPTRKMLPNPDDPALVVSLSLGKAKSKRKQSGNSEFQPSVRERFKDALGSVYFTFASILLVAVSLKHINLFFSHKQMAHWHL